MTSQASSSKANEETYEALISLIENSQGRLAPIVVACDDWALRQRVIEHYEAEAREAKIMPYRVVLGREPSVRSALAKLKDENEYLQRGSEAVFTVTGAETLLRVTLKPEDEQSELDKFFGYLQWTREGLREFRYPIVLWVTYRILKEISRRAPDFWSWRKAVLRFASETENITLITEAQAEATAERPPAPVAQMQPQSDTFLPPLEELQAEIQQLESTSPNSSNLATLYDQLGRVYADRVTTGKAADLDQERQAAIAALQTAIQRYQQLDRKPTQGTALADLGNFLHSQSRFTDAIDVHQQALEITRQISHRQAEAYSLGNLGIAYYSLGQYQQAINLYQQALEINREIGDRQGEATYLNNLGGTYNSLGQYQQAIELLQQSLEIAREISDRQGEAYSLGNLGIAYTSLGQYEQAINLYQQSLEINREIGDRQGEANALGNLGSAYQSSGQYPQAINLYQQQYDIAREIGNRYEEANGLNNLGSVYKSSGQYWEALEKLQQAKQLFAAIGLDYMVERCETDINEVNQLIAAESHT